MKREITIGFVYGCVSVVSMCNGMANASAASRDGDGSVNTQSGDPRPASAASRDGDDSVSVMCLICYISRCWPGQTGVGPAWANTSLRVVLARANTSLRVVLAQRVLTAVRRRNTTSGTEYVESGYLYCMYIPATYKCTGR